MPYNHLKWEAIEDPSAKDLFEHANMYLFDVYGMLRTLPPSDKDGGGSNFSATLVLLCIIDGLATWYYPNENDQEKRFKKLIREKLHWGPEGKDKWVNKGTAADQLYTEFRNPLIHNLATKDNPATSRPKGYIEPVIGRWGNIPKESHNIEKIDSLNKWNDDWPVLSDLVNSKGESHYKLTLPAFYWVVKDMASKLLQEIHSSAGSGLQPEP